MIFGSIYKYLFEHVAGNINNSFSLLIDSSLHLDISIFVYIQRELENYGI